MSAAFVMIQRTGERPESRSSPAISSFSADFTRTASGGTPSSMR